jgi:exoribonuclease R
MSKYSFTFRGVIYECDRVRDLTENHKELFADKYLPTDPTSSKKKERFGKAYIALSNIARLSKSGIKRSWKGWEVTSMLNIKRVTGWKLTKETKAKISVGRAKTYLETSAENKEHLKEVARVCALTLKERHNFSMEFSFVSPEGVIVAGKNIANMIRENSHLFDDEDLVLDEKNMNTAQAGLYRLRRKTNPQKLWKGWKLL